MGVIQGSGEIADFHWLIVSTRKNRVSLYLLAAWYQEYGANTCFLSDSSSPIKPPGRPGGQTYRYSKVGHGFYSHSHFKVTEGTLPLNYPSFATQTATFVSISRLVVC